jgi:peroxiredoxin 2/4
MLSVDISLQKIMADGQWLMLFFYPSAWSFVCPTEIRAFSARCSEFSFRKCAVAFASTDSEFSLKAWNSFETEEGGLGGVHIPLISDRSHRLSRDYGVLVEEDGVAKRATFVIDLSGMIRAMASNDANVGRNVDEAKRVLEALQFTDEFGEGCPSGWKEGEKGVILHHSPLDEDFPYSPVVPGLNGPNGPDGLKL